MKQLLAALEETWQDTSFEPGWRLFLFPPSSCLALRKTSWGHADDPEDLSVSRLQDPESRAVRPWWTPCVG